MYTVKLLLNNDCNLQCSYCFEKGTKYDKCVGVKLNNDIINVIGFINNNIQDIDLLSIMGGETYLDLPSLLLILDKINFHMMSRKVVIHTNGTIFNDDVIKMYNKYQNNIFVVITDHGQDIENDTIYNHVKFLLKSSIPFQVTTLVTRSNLEKPEQLIDYLTYMNSLSNNQLVLHMEYYNPDNPITIDILHNFFRYYITKYDMSIDLQQKIDDCVFKYSKVTTVLNHCEYTPDICGACVNELTIGRDGIIHVCENLLNSNTIWCVENFKSFDELLGDELFHKIHNLNKIISNRCRNCKYFVFCPKCRYNHHLNIDPLEDKSPEICHFTKELYDFTLSIFTTLINKRLTIMEDRYSSIISEISELLHKPNVDVNELMCHLSDIDTYTNEIDGVLILLRRLAEVLNCIQRSKNEE